jgi:hypothetical protein
MNATEPSMFMRTTNDVYQARFDASQSFQN